MKYVIISDIHSNYQALESVAEHISRENADKIICAGDVIGYGAEPDRCISMVSSSGYACVRGNHEAAVLGLVDITFFNEFAASAVEWTRDNLAREGADFIRSLPYVLSEGGMSVTHGTLHSPEEFMYMISCHAAMRTFEEMLHPVCFLGHTHVPGVFTYTDGNIYQSYSEKVEIESGSKYIINAGSVGQPRDNDPRACYCVYDTERSAVEFRRVEYDVDTARKKIIEAGLPRVLGDRLLIGR